MSFPLRTRVRLAVAATMALALAGCSVTETTSTTSSAITDDAASTSGSVFGDESDSTADDATITSDESAATGGSEAAKTTAQGPVTTVEADDETFSLEAPAGWKDAIDTAPNGTVLAAQSTTRTGDSFNTLVVTKGDLIADLDEVVAASIETLQDDDTDVRAASDSRIDGLKAYGFSTTDTSGGDTITNRLRYVNFDGSLYTVTFSTAQVDGEISELANQEFDDIVDSWSWSEQD